MFVRNEIILLFRTGFIIDDANRSKEAYAIKLFIKFASSKEEYRPHLIVALCLARAILFERGYILDSIDAADRAKNLYRVQEHSVCMTQRYGSDFVLQTFAHTLQVLMLYGDISNTMK